MHPIGLRPPDLCKKINLIYRPSGITKKSFSKVKLWILNPRKKEIGKAKE
jgi:hypothetical protein